MQMMKTNHTPIVLEKGFVQRVEVAVWGKVYLAASSEKSTLGNEKRKNRNWSAKVNKQCSLIRVFSLC